MSLELDSEDRAMLAGDFGPAMQAALGMLKRYGESLGARRFIPISSAHIDACLYHGPSSLDFVERFAGLGARVRALTTLNVGAADVTHPELHQGAPGLLDRQARLTSAYAALGCLPTLTCAPYQRLFRPAFGEHVAWAESNAIVFANSVLGARTDRYGDFADLCAAITGKVPETGFHLAERRRPSLILEVASLGDASLERDLYFAAVGYVAGRLAGDRVPAIVGLPADASEDDLKALGATAASSGALAMFHAAGLTPEAPSLAALQASDLPRVTVGSVELRAAVRGLSPVEPGEVVDAVCLGTPHFSASEFRRLRDAIAVSAGPARCPVFVSTSREIAAVLERGPLWGTLSQFGVRLVVDTCTYHAKVVPAGSGVILTNSGKWAYYAPGGLGRKVGLASLSRCIESAVAGYVAS